MPTIFVRFIGRKGMRRMTIGAGIKKMTNGLFYNEVEIRRGIKESLCCFLCYCFVYGALAPRLALHQDEVLDIEGGGTQTYVAAGRWGLALFRWLFGQGIAPWGAGLVAGMALSVAIMLQTRLFHWQSAFLKVVYAAFVLGTIQYSYMLVYSFQADAVAVGYLCSTAAVLILTRPTLRPGAFALSVVCLGWAIAVYQWTASYFAVLCAARLLCSCSAQWKRFSLRAGSCVCLACLLWLAVRGATIPLVEEECRRYVDSYTSGMSGWSTFFSMDAHLKWMCAAHNAKSVVADALGFSYAGQWVYVTAIIPFVGLLWGCVRGACSWGERGVRVSLLFFIWLAPFSFPLLMLTYGGPRLNMAEPVACAVLWSLFLRKMEPGLAMKKLVVAFCVFVVLKGGYTVSRFASAERVDYARHLEELRDIRLQGLALLEEKEGRIYCYAPRKTGEKAEALSWPGIPHDYNPVRKGVLDWYASAFHLEPLAQATGENRDRAKRLLDAAPVWPQKGSMVRGEDGNVYVKLGEF